MKAAWCAAAASRTVAVLTCLASCLFCLSAEAAGGDCAGLAVHAKQVLNGGKCKDLKAELSALSRAPKGCAAAIGSVQAQIKARLLRDCACADLESAVRTVPADVSKLECDDALRQLGSLRLSRGSCKTDNALRELAAAEIRLAQQIKNLGPACDKVCHDLAERVQNKTSASGSGEAVKCYGCAEAERKRCQSVDSTRPNPASSVLEELFAALDVVNHEIRGKPDCAKATGCLELEQERMRILTLLLALLDSSGLAETDKNLRTRVLDTLRVMGLESNLAKVLLNHSAEEVLATAQLSRAASNEELRRYLIEQLAPFKEQGFEPILEALRSGASLEGLLSRAKGLTKPQQTKLFRVAGAVGVQESGVRHDFLDQILKSRLDVVLPSSANEKPCGNCGDFWGRIRAELTTAQQPNWIYGNSVKEELGKRLALRESICAGQRTDASNPACGPVLALEAESQRDGSVLITPYLRYVRGPNAPGGKVVVSELAMSQRRLPVDAKKEVQDVEARGLASAIVYQFNQLLQVPITYTPGTTAPEPSGMCGASVTVAPTATAPPANGKLRAPKRECRNPAFRDELVRELEKHQLRARLDLDELTSAASGEQRDVTAPFECSLDVAKPSGEPTFSLTAMVQDLPDCKGKLTEKAQHAARIAAWQLATYFYRLDAEKMRRNSDGPKPVVLAPPPYLHSFYFSGARQLEHSRGRRGWGWAIGEAGLIVAGTTLAALAVNARSQTNPSDRQIDRANFLLNSAYGSFILILPLRAIAGAFCCSESP